MGNLSVEALTVANREEWNSFVKNEPSFGIFQSWEWGTFKEHMGWKVYRIAVVDAGNIIAGAQVLIRFIIPGLVSIAYIPRGPIGNWLDSAVSGKLFSAIHQIALENHAVLLKIEPPLLNDPPYEKELEKLNFHPSPIKNQPRSTIILDLKPELETILGQIRKSTRRKISDGAKKGLTVRLGGKADLSTFYKLMKITGRRARFAIRPFRYYQTEWDTFNPCNQSLMLLAVFDGQPIAIHVSYIFGCHAAFFHQASSNQHGALNANSLLVWESMKKLKEMGCCTYDMWGIPDEIGEIACREGEIAPCGNRTDGLWGAYQFKCGFGKNVVCYAGAYDYVYKAVWYPLVSKGLLNTNTLETLLAWLDNFKSSGRRSGPSVNSRIKYGGKD